MLSITSSKESCFIQIMSVIRDKRGRNNESGLYIMGKSAD